MSAAELQKAPFRDAGAVSPRSASSAGRHSAMREQLSFRVCGGNPDGSTIGRLQLSRTQQCQKVTTSNPHSPHPEKNPLSAPQLQAQLSLLSDSTRVQRLKHFLHTKGAWQHVTRTEGLCHSHVSPEWLYHLDACAGSVLTPHDCITNVQKRLGNSAVFVGHS